MWGGQAYELVRHHEWIRNAEMFSILKKLVFFNKQTLFLVGGGRGCRRVGFKGPCMPVNALMWGCVVWGRGVHSEAGGVCTGWCP